MMIGTITFGTQMMVYMKLGNLPGGTDLAIWLGQPAVMLFLSRADEWANQRNRVRDFFDKLG